MIISEKGLVRCLKRAYKSGGYNILRIGEDLCLYTEGWFVRAVRKELPNEVHSTIVKHAGSAYLDERQPLHIAKDEEPQVLMLEVVNADLAYWTEATAGCFASVVPMVYMNYQLLQESGGAGPCFGIRLTTLDLLEEDVIRNERGTVWKNHHAAWGGDGETVICKAYRATDDPMASDNEKKIWEALENVNLQ